MFYLKSLMLFYVIPIVKQIHLFVKTSVCLGKLKQKQNADMSKTPQTIYHWIFIRIYMTHITSRTLFLVPVSVMIVYCLLSFVHIYSHVYRHISLPTVLFTHGLLLSSIQGENIIHQRSLFPKRKGQQHGLGVMFIL